MRWTGAGPKDAEKKVPSALNVKPRETVGKHGSGVTARAQFLGRMFTGTRGVRGYRKGLNETNLTRKTKRLYDIGELEKKNQVKQKENGEALKGLRLPRRWVKS